MKTVIEMVNETATRGNQLLLSVDQVRRLRDELIADKAINDETDSAHESCIALTRHILGTRAVHGPYEGIDRINAFVLADELIAERRRQDAQWGGPEHDDEHAPLDWTDFIRKFCENANAAFVLNQPPAEYERRLIQVAALAIAAIQSSRRKNK